jgi:hypothetical protein
MTCALLQLQAKRGADQFLRDLQQLLGQRDEFAGRQAAMTLVQSQAWDSSW